MKANYKIVMLAATTLLLGGISVSATTSNLPQIKSQQLLSMCPGGGYPILVCEIINGKEVCIKKCPDAFLKG